MINSQRPDESAAHNERSLNTVVRAIAFSQGQFSLILVRCNYDSLRERMVERLRSLASVEIRELFLPESVTTLYNTIRSSLALSDRPQALMVFGLESARDLERLLSSTNQVREEFRKSFPFPVVLWVNDEVLKTLIRLAPDFESWATTSEFLLPTDELIDNLQLCAQSVFSSVMEAGTSQFLPNNAILGSRYRLELNCARRDLRESGVQLERKLEASLQFVIGRDDYANDKIDNALEQYQQSLAFWQGGDALRGATGATRGGVNSPNPVQEGLLLFHIGLCYQRQGQLQRAMQRQRWEEARHCFDGCVKVFERSGRPELVAKFIGQLGDILLQLEDWSALSAVAKKSLKLHKVHGSPLYMAQDYGFLAEVALQQSKWEKARKLAEGALSTLDNAPAPLTPQHKSLYLLLLARSQAKLGNVESAVKNLETARTKSDPQYDPLLYLGILEQLRSLYFQQGKYLKAFWIKQEYGSIEQQFGLRAFIGAGRLESQRHTINPAIPQGEKRFVAPAMVALEIAASGRENDVNRLIERLGRDDYNLTVIHGQSGVGKSSLVQAGLVPAIAQKVIGARNALPVLLQVYTDWVPALGKLLTEGLREVGSGGTRSPGSSVEGEMGSFPNPQALLDRLRKNGDRNCLTVLIFDQFEEFFFVSTEPAKKREFYDFLRDCLNIPFVKVILSLREDYLHYLLECDRISNLDAVNNDILKKDVRYYLGNFSHADARNVIQSLTERSQFYLEPALIDELVRDLARESGEVRPIELQVVGAQLQAQNITTLDEYQKSGPKEKLVKNFLEKAIEDCGPENKRAARLVLYFLTDESNIRPLRTRAELVAELAADLAGKAENLDLILEILVKSGLVFLLPEVTGNRYQLAHDYLVALIRQQDEIKKELKALRERNKQLQELLDQLAEARNKEQKFLRIALIIAVICAGVFGLLEWRAENERNQAEIAREQADNARRIAAIAEIDARNSAAKAFLLSNNELGALVDSVKAATKLPETQVPIAIKTETVNRLQQTFYKVTERNRLEGHSKSVVDVNFSPDGKLIATASTDNTVKLFSPEGEAIATLTGHSDPVTRVRFSPDGQTIASASKDNTVKLWKRNGSLIRTLKGHTNGVTSVSFSPDGELLATAGLDKTVRLWNKGGSLLKTLKGHSESVTSVSFSPDGDTIATASSDKTVKLWNRDGRLLRTLSEHMDAVSAVSFSPDGETIASASADKTVKLWKKDGTFIKTLSGHKDSVLGVSFSPDGEIIASASADNTVTLWSRDGMWIRILKGHLQEVWSVSFSPDGKTIATASSDNTVKLWQSYGRELPAFKGHSDRVLSVSFSPDGQILASASKDKTVKLWHRDGKAIATLKGHSAAVWNVSFCPDGKLIASASADKTVKLWSLEGKELKTLEGHSERVLGVSFSPDGQTIATASEDKTVKLWSLDGKVLSTLRGHSAAVNSVSFSPRGDRIATASEDKSVKLWSNSGKLLATLSGHKDHVFSVSFSPEGDTIATASKDNTVKLWSVDGKAIATLEGHIGPVNWVSFSPDGQLIATASNDKTVKLWSREGKLLTTLEGHTEPVLSVSFSPDGKRVASASEDKTVILWNLDLEELLKRSCFWLHDYLKSNPNVYSDRNLCDGIDRQK